MNFLYYPAIPSRDLISFVLSGVFMFCMALILSGSVDIPSADITCPRYFTCFWKSDDLLTFILRFAFLSLSNTCVHLSIWWASVWENTMMSSKYIIRLWRVNPFIAISISLLNVAGELVNPIGMETQEYNPDWVQNAVLSLASSDNGTYNIIIEVYLYKTLHNN